MPWLDLRAEVAEEFGQLVGGQEDLYDTGRKLESQVRRANPVAWAREYAMAKQRRLQRREQRAAQRPPCPHCEGPVERVGKTGRIPKYCTPKCMRAARFKRWWEKHGHERNVRRRKAAT